MKDSFMHRPNTSKIVQMLVNVFFEKRGVHVFVHVLILGSKFAPSVYTSGVRICSRGPV